MRLLPDREDQALVPSPALVPDEELDTDQPGTDEGDADGQDKARRKT